MVINLDEDISEGRVKAKLNGVNVRDIVTYNELSLALSLDENSTSESDKARRSSPKYRDILGLKGSVEDIVEHFRSSGINIDIFGGIAYSMGDFYSYLLNLTPSKSGVCGMESTEFKTLLSTIKNINSFYNTILNFKAQFSKSVIEKDLIDTDSTISDQDGKAMDVNATLIEEEGNSSIVSDSDTTIRSRFKIYLDFLYRVAQATRSGVEDGVYEILAYLWVLDTYEWIAKEDDKNTIQTSYFRNEKILPIIRQVPAIGTGVKISSSIGKTSIKQLISDNNLSLKNLIKCIERVCRKAYAQYQQKLIDTEGKELGSNIFLFARYIYRIFQLCKIPMFDNIDKPYLDIEDIRHVILDKSNPNSLRNLIPSKKFNPSFFNNSKIVTLNDWLTYSVENLELEYNIPIYDIRDKDEKEIHAPVLSMINSVSSVAIPKTMQSVEGLKLDFEREKSQLLQLKHLVKLLGTAAGSGKQVYTALYDAKYRRVLNTEPDPKLNSNKNKDDSISEKVIEEINNRANAIIYSINAINSNVFNTAVEAKYANNEFLTVDDTVKKFIDDYIDKKVKTIADIYMDYYHKNGWSFSFMRDKNDLIQRIRQTRKIEKLTNQDIYVTLLLGDLLTIPIQLMPERNNVEAKKYNGALLNDYKIGVDSIIYIPEIIYGEDGTPKLCAMPIGS